MADVSLVVPTLDRPEALYNLLRHLEHQSVRPREIVVVDQSAREDRRSAALPGVRMLRIAERGLPNARNVGARASLGDVLLFVDDDSIPDRDLVRFHAERYADPSVAGVGGRVVGGYDRAQGQVGRFDAARGRVVRNFGALAACEVDHLPGGNMSFRRSVFDRIGGFDTAFGGSAIGEETDFCLRGRAAGFRFVFEPRASVEHLHLPTGGCREPDFARWLYWHSHNTTLFALRHARWGAWPRFLLGRVARLGIWAVEHGSLPLLATGLRGLLKGISTHARHA
jgi:GT2 family glycosyltransferase